MSAGIAWRPDGLGYFGKPGVQAIPDLFRGVGASAALTSGDHHSGGGDTREACQARYPPPPHVLTLAGMNSASITIDAALDMTLTGDVWLFRGHKAADRAVQLATNSPVNHVGMSVVIGDLPPLMWHAELSKSLPDLWSGGSHRGVQLHDLREAVLIWATRYGQKIWLRQLDPAITREMEDALLLAIARMDGTPFPTTARLAGRWLGGRVPAPRRRKESSNLETAYCAEVLAATYQAMGLLPGRRRANWYDAGSFWSGDDLSLAAGFALGGEIAVQTPVASPSPPHVAASGS